MQHGDPGVMAWVSLRRDGIDPWRHKNGEFYDKFVAARSALDAQRTKASE